MGKIFFAFLLVFSNFSCAEESKVTKKQEPIGVATMKDDGTIFLNLRAETDGVVGHALEIYTPKDPEYEQIKNHLGGIKPGENKPIPPWDK